MPPAEPATGAIRQGSDDRVRKAVEDQACRDGEPGQDSVQPQDLVVVEHGVGADRGEDDGVADGSDSEEELGAKRQPVDGVGLGAGHELTP